MNVGTEFRVATNGIETHGWRTGGDGPPVLLLHGLTDNGACWAMLARELAGDYDLVMPDARGHGASSVPETGYSPEDRTADAIALIDALGLERPVVIGHSMGGLTAALIAAQAPERIRGAILEDPAFISPENWVSPQRLGWKDQHRLTLTMSEAELIARGRAESPRWHPEVFPTWARSKLEAKIAVFDWLHLPHSDFWDISARIAVPTLLVTGEPALGAIISADVAAALQAGNPLLEVAHVPGVGHCIRYEQPHHFARLTREFLVRQLGR